MADDRNAVIDRMTEFAMEELLSGESVRRQTLVRRLAERWPQESAYALSFAVTNATSLIEDGFGDAAVLDPVVPLGYRIASLIAADIHAIQSMGQTPPIAEDLLHFWRRADPAYLDFG